MGLHHLNPARLGRLFPRRTSSLHLAQKRDSSHPPPPAGLNDPLSGLVRHLAAHLPHFRSPADSITVLKEPSQFYRELLNLIRGAKKRIFIASLYVGKEETDLAEAIRKALETNEAAKLTILVDYLRSTREHSRGQECSASLLGSLQGRFPGRVEIRLFHTSELFGTLKRLVPRRFDEGFGLQHMKIYGADRDIIMSGANLSSDYFTNRQDRYVKLTGQEGLSDYLYELIDLTGSISYRLDEGAAEDERRPGKGSLKIVWPETNASRPPIDSKRASEEFKAAANQLYRSFTDRWRLKLLAQSSNNNTHSPLPLVSIFPTLQISPFKIRQETGLMIPQLIQLVHQLSNPPSPSHQKTVLNWTSGYFSLLREYKRQMLSSTAHVEIITAAPQANGFFQSNGVSKYVPQAYSYLENMFRNEVRKANKQEQIVIRRWNQAGWTYHAKGIWINQLSGGEGGEAGTERCLVTSIGSSNYGRRSAERDLECNLFIILDGEQQDPGRPGHPQPPAESKSGRTLSGQFVDELAALKGHVDPADQKDAHVGIGVKFFTRLIRNML